MDIEDDDIGMSEQHYDEQNRKKKATTDGRDGNSSAKVTVSQMHKTELTASVRLDKQHEIQPQ